MSSIFFWWQTTIGLLSFLLLSFAVYRLYKNHLEIVTYFSVTGITISHISVTMKPISGNFIANKKHKFLFKRELVRAIHLSVVDRKTYLWDLSNITLSLCEDCLVTFRLDDGIYTFLYSERDNRCCLDVTTPTNLLRLPPRRDETYKNIRDTSLLDIRNGFAALHDRLRTIEPQE